MENQDEIKVMMQKIMAASPFIMLRYITLPGNTTLEEKSKLAFANAYNKDEFHEHMEGFREYTDHELIDHILGSGEEFILDLIEQLKVIVSAISEGEESFMFKKKFFDFAVDMRLFIDEANEIEELPVIHQAALTTLATSLKLFEEMSELEG